MNGFCPSDQASEIWAGVALFCRRLRWTNLSVWVQCG